MPLSRRRRPDGPTPLATIAGQSGLTLTSRTWLERTVGDVAFDEFAFGQDVLCDDAPAGFRGALERGQRADGLTLAVGSVEWLDLPRVWIAAQSKRGANHLALDGRLDALGATVGHSGFDDTFDLDADDDAMDVVRSVLTDELCEWAVRLDEQHGPLMVIFDGEEDETPDEPAHGAAMFLAREIDDDEAFVETLGLTVELVTKFRPATDL